MGPPESTVQAPCPTSQSYVDLNSGVVCARRKCWPQSLLQATMVEALTTIYPFLGIMTLFPISCRIKGTNYVCFWHDFELYGLYSFMT